jgi:hypothetical protein
VSINKLNDAPILDQLDEQYQKLLAILVWKLQRDGSHPNGVTITHKDLVAYTEANARGEAVFLTHGHFDSIEFKSVTKQRAAELAKWDAAQKGNA